ncbi:MAG: YgjV family protein [Lachnospiraceae bacterium]|nr:YgjV family protein [Lachnospiraceae bacterium]
MSILLIGNAFALVGAILMIVTGFLKTKKQILGVQIVQFTLMGIGNFLLGGISGAVSNAVGILRNVVGFKKEFTLPYKLFFVAIQAVLTLVFYQAGLGILAWFPFFATVMFTWCMDSLDERVLKAAIIGGELLWAFYDFHFMNYASLTCDIFTIVSNTVGIFLVLRRKPEPEAAE